jgi:hypothetical protein
MNLKKYLLLDLKKVGIIIVSFIVAAVLHNLIYGIFNIEEAVFFLLAVFVIPLYFVISVGYTVFHHVKKKKKK